MRHSSLVALMYTWLLTTHVLAKSSSRSIEAAIEIMCPPCDKIACPVRNGKLKCGGGISVGVCNCCPRCARLEGEKCGGVHNYNGDCDTGLFCDVSQDFTNVIRSDIDWQEPVPEGICRRGKLEGQSCGGRHNIHGHCDVGLFCDSTNTNAVSHGRGKNHQPRGICRPEPVETPDLQKDAPFRDDNEGRFRRCKHECTPGFCEKNPRGICSARSNADGTSSCQGACMHTSCRACRYVYAHDDCPKCDQNDYKCIKRFGTCVRQQECHKDRFPCKQNKKPTELAGRGTFMCSVPDCS